MFASKTLFVAFVCSVIVNSSSAVSGDEAAPVPAPAKEYFPQPTERAARLDATLDQHLSIAFQETPLADVAAWFASKLEAPVILDHRSLEDAGIGSETPVTRKVDGISARAALKLVLDDMDLASVQKDGVLILMSQDGAEVELITRVYPVGDLTPLVPQSASNHRGGGMSGAIPAKPAEEVARTAADEAAQPPRMAPDFDSLVEVITNSVKPQSWGEVGGPGSISEMRVTKSIVVSQTREVHDEILELLRALRSAKGVTKQTSANEN